MTTIQTTIAEKLESLHEKLLQDRAFALEEKHPETGRILEVVVQLLDQAESLYHSALILQQRSKHSK